MTLTELLTNLITGDARPCPEGDDWHDIMESISTEGVIQEVSEETYWYFLEVLPPIHQWKGYYVFAEGLEPYRLFWIGAKGKFYCRQLSWDETNEFTRLRRATVVAS